MKNTALFFCFGFLIFSGCKQTVDNTQLDALKTELVETKTALEKANSKLEALKTQKQ